jgi:hypothetical protein
MRFLCLHGLGTNSEVGGTLAEIEVPSVDSARQVLEAQTGICATFLFQKFLLIAALYSVAPL